MAKRETYKVKIKKIWILIPQVIFVITVRYDKVCDMKVWQSNQEGVTTYIREQ